jgi:hypothetical protein
MRYHRSEPDETCLRETLGYRSFNSGLFTFALREAHKETMIRTMRDEVPIT